MRRASVAASASPPSASLHSRPRRGAPRARASAGGAGSMAAGVRAELVAAIRVGAPLFNAGRPGDCFRTYRGAAQRLAAAAPAGDEVASLLRYAGGWGEIGEGGRGGMPGHPAGAQQPAWAQAQRRTAARERRMQHTRTPSAASTPSPPCPPPTPHPHRPRRALLEADAAPDPSAAAWVLRRAFDAVIGGPRHGQLQRLLARRACCRAAGPRAVAAETAPRTTRRAGRPSCRHRSSQEAPPPRPASSPAAQTASSPARRRPLTRCLRG